MRVQPQPEATIREIARAAHTLGLEIHVEFVESPWKEWVRIRAEAWKHAPWLCRKRRVRRRGGVPDKNGGRLKSWVGPYPGD